MLSEHRGKTDEVKCMIGKLENIKDQSQKTTNHLITSSRKNKEGGGK